MPKWPTYPNPSPAEAARIQERLRGRVVAKDDYRAIRTVGGVDVAIGADRAVAAVVVLAFPALELLDSATAERPLEFPYVPGLLAFREMPAVRDAFAKLATRPDLVFVDGHGYAHPRRFGIACMLGVEMDLPSVGIGKSLLVGSHRAPGGRRGSRAALRDGGELIGYALRTRDGVRPVYVSIGHRIGLASAVRLTLRVCRRYRLPEPIRQAHMLAGRAKRREAPGPKRGGRQAT
jgi:deoxyribonuclease V